MACNGIPTIDIQNSYQPLSPAGCRSTLGESPMSVICLCNTLLGISLHANSNMYVLTDNGMMALRFLCSCQQQPGTAGPYHVAFSASVAFVATDCW